ncbi:MAG: hypothetical protein RIC19_18555 [Phaeodactylibacter sp.]
MKGEVVRFGFAVACTTPVPPGTTLNGLCCGYLDTWPEEHKRTSPC